MMNENSFQQNFEGIIPQLKAKIMQEFNLRTTQAGYRSVWEHFEEVITPILIDFLTAAPFEIAKQKLKIAKSKGAYPDLKIEHDGNYYAIDVKSGEDTKNPWYDVARLDTYQEKHLNVYTEEYSIVVCWANHDAPQVIDVYIEPTYKTVGYRLEYDGILYRPYDGKIRPKSWADFKNGFTHWNTKAEFMAGFENAKTYRRLRYMLEWYTAMNETQKQDFRKQLDLIDAA